MTEKKVVVKVDVPDDKGKQKALKVVASLSGINAISMDMKEKKMTVIGVVDPIGVVEKLRKHWHAIVITIGPKEEPKKEEPKKEESKKDDAKKDDTKKEEPKPYYPHLMTPLVIYSSEEDPNACVIC